MKDPGQQEQQYDLACNRPGEEQVQKHPAGAVRVGGGADTFRS